MTDYSQFEFDMDDLSRHEFGGLAPPTKPGDKIILGICAMPKKARSTPMEEILGRLDPEHFEILKFPKEVIFDKPVEEWPLVHCLIAFFSDGFPLEKAERYAELRKPFMINELKTQHLLKDRRHMMNLMRKYGVPIPEQVVMNRTNWSPSGFPVAVNEEDDMQEFEDYIVVNGERMDKPFVEKPVDGEDHNIYIYYPRSAGGGSCRLFRKVKNRSSEFFPNENNVRRGGSFIYEKFLTTEGSDVKVYTVTPNYAHSEARKSPAIDGVVSRNEEGFEVRYPVLLTNVEKEIAARIVQATGQRICGFDVLRSDNMSYVCDVNGWSFVKNNHKYYDDAALILTELMRKAMGIDDAQEGWPIVQNSEEDSDETDAEAETTGTGEGVHEELRCVIAVVRHGDRTPKQKLKMKVTDPDLLGLFEKYGEGKNTREELKLKSARELSDVLHIIGDILDRKTAKHGASAVEDSDCDDREEIDALLQARSVLEMHGTFKGINRKVQLKPTKWDVDDDDYDGDDEGGAAIISEAQFILKWGGVLTGSGREQAELLGQSFRQKLYPFDGLLRLHSTYRHDLKIYSSNEGRVQVTAAAFAKGMLQLEGHLTPILASLVRKSPEVDTLLDDASDAKNPIQTVKKRLHKALLAQSSSKDFILKTVAPTGAISITKALEGCNFDPRGCMRVLHYHIAGLVKQLRVVVSTQRARFGISAAARKTGVANTGKLLDIEDDNSPGPNEGGSAAASLMRVESDRNLQSIVSDNQNSSDLLMSLYRWTKLEKDFYNKKKEKYDLSKIPDISDSVKFDLLHNRQLIKLQPPNLKKIFELSRHLADVIVPQEYGISHQEKKSIGSRIAKSLAARIQSDLKSTIINCMRLRKQTLLKKEMSFSQSPLMSTTSTAVPPVSDLISTASDVEEEEEEEEIFHQLDKRYARSLGIKSRNRMVKTRLYFTSESHLHSLLNVLRYTCAEQLGTTVDNVELPVISAANMAKLEAIEELNYLTHIVFRLFEITPNRRRKKRGSLQHPNSSSSSSARADDEPAVGEFPRRFRISVAISPGVGVRIDEQDQVIQGEGQPSKSSRLASAKTAYGSKASDIQLHPCSPLIPLWSGIEYNQLDVLFKKCLKDVQEEMNTPNLKLAEAGDATPPNAPTPEPMVPSDHDEDEDTEKCIK